MALTARQFIGLDPIEVPRVRDVQLAAGSVFCNGYDFLAVTALDGPTVSWAYSSIADQVRSDRTSSSWDLLGHILDHGYAYYKPTPLVHTMFPDLPVAPVHPSPAP